MRLYLLISLSLLSFSLNAHAASKEGGFRLFGNYGMAPFIGPPDVNRFLSNSPPAEKLSNDTFFGGGLGLRLGAKWEFELSYEAHRSINPSRTYGAELLQNVAWAGLNYRFLRQDDLLLYAGVMGGYPTNARAIVSMGTRVDYEADPRACFMLKAGGAIIIGSNFSIFGEIGYQGMQQGFLKNGTTYLKADGANVTMDLSGGRFSLGGSVIF
jgi:hypothetical protein